MIPAAPTPHHAPARTPTINPTATIAASQMIWDRRGRMLRICGTASSCRHRTHRTSHASILDPGRLPGEELCPAHVVELARWLKRGLESYCFDVMLFDPPAHPPSIDEITETLTDVWADTLKIVTRI
jgi:hypothetical protein